MKTAQLTLLFSLAFHLSTQAQNIAIIKDPDGFVNVREKPGLTSRIVGKFYNGEVFSYGDETNGWVEVTHANSDSSKGDIDGYIYKDRLLPLNQLQKNPKSTGIQMSDTRYIHTKTLSVEIHLKPFDPKEHILTRKGQELETIDGKKIFGTDGELPKIQILSCKFHVNDQPLSIPDAAWNDLYDPNLGSCAICMDDRTGYSYVLLCGGDGAGAYDTVWIFKDGKYLSRYVDQSWD